MKNYLAALILIMATITACNDNASSSKKDSPAVNKGSQLIAGSDCAGCHKVDEKLVGPSFRDIATKYDSSKASELADKVINGGEGEWGQVPMAAHPGLSKDDAKEMVRYILSLKK